MVCRWLSLFCLPASLLPACTYLTDETPMLPLLEAVEVRSVPYTLPVITSAELMGAIGELPDLMAFILYQSGVVHHEFYCAGAAADRDANIKSASKSVISALVGIAVDRRYIADVDDPVSAYLPHYFEDLEPAKGQITIRHLLTMSSGLASTSSEGYGRWVASSDWIRHALAQPLIDPPGTRMLYSTGDTHLLAAVLTAAVGMPLRRFAELFLFEPLGVHLGGWDQDPQGVYFGGNNMALSPSALLAFGRMYLQQGRHDALQILSPRWIEESWQVRFPLANEHRTYNYGYLWWHRRMGGFDAWFAWGHGGQHVFVLPGLDAVAVFTAEPDQGKPDLNDAILRTMEQAVVPWLYHTLRLSRPAIVADASPAHTVQVAGCAQYADR